MRSVYHGLDRFEILKSYWIFKFQAFKIPRFIVVKILRLSNLGNSRLHEIRIPHELDLFEILKSFWVWGPQAFYFPRYQGYKILRFPNLENQGFSRSGSHELDLSERLKSFGFLQSRRSRFQGFKDSRF